MSYPTLTAMRRGLGLITLMIGLGLPTHAALAADEATVLRSRAANLATNDDCHNAVRLLDRAARLDPAGGTNSALLQGRCLVQLQRYIEAKPLLEQVVALDPSSGEAALALGMARYHLGDSTGAYRELVRAEQKMPERPEPPLYIGLILLDREEASKAAARLDRSSSLNTDGFEPASNYFAAVAHASAGDPTRSDASLERVQRLAPGSVWGKRAAEALENAKRRRIAPDLGRWVTLRAGLDYDSNVSLRSDRVSQPRNISNDEDGRGWWGVDAGAELFRREGWSGGVGANYTGYEYFRERDFDQHFVTGRLWLDRMLGKKTMFRLTPEGGVGFFDGTEYLRFGGIRPELRRDWGRFGIGTLYARYAYNDFRIQQENQTIAAKNFRDRDGHEINGGYDHQIPLGDKTTIRGGVFGLHYIAQGGEYDVSGGGGWLGLRQVLPLGFTLDVAGSVSREEYDGRTSFALASDSNDDRQDTIGTASAVLSRRINKWLTLSGRYQYLDNDSNAQVFNYQRHIVGAFFTVDVLELF